MDRYIMAKEFLYGGWRKVRVIEDYGDEYLVTDDHKDSIIQSWTVPKEYTKEVPMTDPKHEIKVVKDGEDYKFTIYWEGVSVLEMGGFESEEEAGIAGNHALEANASPPQGKGRTCPQCQGRGNFFFLKTEDEVCHDICDRCEGTGTINE